MSTKHDHQDCFYYYCGRSPEIDKISDREQFKETIQAMQVLGPDPRRVKQNKQNSLLCLNDLSFLQISDILKILGSILHLGNIKFANKYKKVKDELDLEGCYIYLDHLHLCVMRELLLIKADELRKWLLMR
uniref:Myosin motor domain-containing protein n=1 Tax=Glossina morsitans morsitans TaxID=37546 RepID=A0A1B0GEC7_GLOMM